MMYTNAGSSPASLAKLSLWGDLKNRIMNRNTRKFIWNGFWAISILAASILILTHIREWFDWLLYGLSIILAGYYIRKVEETFKED